MSPSEPPPADDDPPYVRRPLLGWIFWTGLVFGLVCIALGAAVALWGPRLMPPARPAPVSRPAAAMISAPTRGELAGAFPAAAAQAAAAVRAPRTGPPSPTDPDAVLARAQRAAAAGDLDLAMCDLVALPPAGQKAMSAWKEGAERRIAVEQRLARAKGTSALP